MSSYSLELLQEKLSRLNSTQESIETLSLWIIHHKPYASTSISTWMEDMRSGTRQLTRFVNNFKLHVLLYNSFGNSKFGFSPWMKLVFSLRCFNSYFN